MNFNTYQFLLIFLPVVLVTFYLVPPKWRVGVILIGSLVFYGMSGVLPLFLLISTVVVGYLSVKYLGENYRSAGLVVALLYPFGILFLFKYLGFGLRVFGVSIEHHSPLNIFLLNVLPAGISFYTFQVSSYIIDVAKKNTRKQDSLIQLGAYITFFPQLIAGPILRYQQLGTQLEKLHSISFRHVRFLDGMFYISVGLAYKVFFSDVLYTFHEVARLLPRKSSLDALYEIVSYSSIIYFDFWGYSLMAIGLALLFGIEVPRNFREPYRSRSPKEFWRRWHVTLSYWLKDYVYLSLGGNNKYIRNILIVFVACGFWHGAGFGFLLWGLLHAVYVIFYHLTSRNWDRAPNTLQILVTYSLVSLSWPLFYAGTLQYFEILKYLFGVNGLVGSNVISHGQWLYLFVTLAWIFAFREDRFLFSEKSSSGLGKAVLVGVVFSFAIIFVSFRRTFIYFQF